MSNYVLTEELDGEEIPEARVEEIWICPTLDRCNWYPPASFEHLADVPHPFSSLQADSVADAVRMLSTRDHFGAWVLFDDGVGERWFPVTITERD